MQVNSVQNYNNVSNFKAKLKIEGETFYGDVFNKMLEKADMIGTDKDIIDIKYVGYYVNKSNDRFMGKFVGKLLKKGNNSGTDKVQQNIQDTTRYSYREKAKKAAINFVDDLYAKYVK